MTVIAVNLSYNFLSTCTYRAGLTLVSVDSVLFQFFISRSDSLFWMRL